MFVNVWWHLWKLHHFQSPGLEGSVSVVLCCFCWVRDAQDQRSPQLKCRNWWKSSFEKWWKAFYCGLFFGPRPSTICFMTKNYSHQFVFALLIGWRVETLMLESAGKEMTVLRADDSQMSVKCGPAADQARSMPNQSKPNSNEDQLGILQPAHHSSLQNVYDTTSLHSWSQNPHDYNQELVYHCISLSFVIYLYLFYI